jgi:hypothetical protein
MLRDREVYIKVEEKGKQGDKEGVRCDSIINNHEIDPCVHLFVSVDTVDRNVVESREIYLYCI